MTVIDFSPFEEPVFLVRTPACKHWRLGSVCCNLQRLVLYVLAPGFLRSHLRGQRSWFHCAVLWIFFALFVLT